MKKIILSLLVLATFALAMPMLFAAEGEEGTVVVHFKTWDSNYENMHAWTWGTAEWGNNVFKPRDAELDEFGALFTFEGVKEVAPTSDATFGFIAVLGNDWDYVNENGTKKTNDVLIPQNLVKGGQTVHIYIFQGADKDKGQAYFVADPAKHNLLFVYFDPSGSYEENIGIHHWNGWDLPTAEWGTPVEVFEDGARTVTNATVKVAMITATPDGENGVKDAGFLIYAGGDPNKKTGDVKLRDAYGASTAPAGSVAFAYVYSKGNAYTANDNVLYGEEGFEEFMAEAFTFRLQPFKQENGVLSGTFAKNPVTVFVKTSAQVNNLYAAADPADKVDAMEEMISWFELVEKTGENTFGTPIPIERLDFAPNATTVSDFVINLNDANKLDNTKQYVLRFDDGTSQAEIQLNLDTQAPQIVFVSPLGIVGKPAEERIILVQWGVPFNLTNFPQFQASDDRDGILTPYVYVPAGENSILDTREEGDYTIALRVSDAWGNTTTETFIFRVQK